MDDMITGYAIAAFWLSAERLLEEVRQGRLSAQDATDIVNRALSDVGKLTGLSQMARTRADEYLKAVLTKVSPGSTP